jgi:hypothetical protein
MSDDTSPHLSKSGRFVKGVHRAVFSADMPDVVSPPITPQTHTAPIQTTQSAPVAAQPVQYVQQVAPKVKNRRSAVPVLFFLLFLLLGSLAVLSFQLFWDSRATLSKLEQAAPQVLQDLETKDIVARVRKHMVLPDEEPLVNTVTDADKVRQEPFYAKAQNGDKVIVFSTRAILYNPTLDKIVEVGFIRQVTPTPLAEASGSASSVAGAATSSGRILLQNEKK